VWAAALSSCTVHPSEPLAVRVARPSDKEHDLRTPKLTWLAFPLLSVFLLQACYSGHAIQRDQLTAVQSSVKERAVEVQTVEGKKLTVTESTPIEVTDQDGLSYRLQPFTFKVTKTQLVAPEQDLVLPLGFIERIEVRKLSTLGTVGLVGVGAAASAVIVIGIAATAGEDTGF